MAFGFGAGSPDSGMAEAEPLMIPPAIKLTSRDDMCDERGGITFIILIAILVLYLATRYHILISGSVPLKNVTSPLYDHDKPKQSTFRRFMLTLEKIFVLPFVPSELDSFVMWMFMWFIAITIPMAVTRYYESRWAHDLITLQGPLNLISYYVFGCGSLDLTAIPYSEVVEEAPPRFPPPPKSDKWGRIDYFFCYHLGIGIMWLIVGFIQIYKAKAGGWSLFHKTNWKAHRVFGRVAILIVCAHIFMMAIMTRENPVNQHPIIYSGMVV
mmetsp:Transcript_14229/g.24177  ORF Transcript_14229/g.24177 Transcript_14229/m.24177 type:complete len:269 (-) Transcript_14229:1019-1825(-)